MATELRAITRDETAAFRTALMTTFGGDPDDDPGGAARFDALIDPARAWAVFDGGTMVATAATFDLAIGVPGGATLAMAGLTMVSVRPTHRRRGLLRELMRRHLDDARARRFPVSGLWASEAAIYGRFGYGVAAEHHAVEVSGAAGLEVAAGQDLDGLEWIDEPRARELLPGIYARATRDRPGALRRSDVWWRERRFLEAPFVRDGASRRRHAVAVRGGAPVGYLQYRQRGDFRGGVATGKTEVIELIATDARAEATLWKLACGMDLFPDVSWWAAPPDHALPWIVSDPRRVSRRISDNLWLRIEDVIATLGARRYAADGTLRLAVDDATWQLVAQDGHATIEASDGEPELRMDRATLGSLYLGGVPAATLARAGRLHGAAAAIATADQMFASPIAPWCPEVF